MLAYDVTDRFGIAIMELPKEEEIYFCTFTNKSKRKTDNWPDVFVLFVCQIISPIDPTSTTALK